MFVSGPIVHPDHGGRGIDAFLLESSEQRAAETAAAATPPAAATLSVWTHERDDERIALYTARGYRHVRTFTRLQVALAQPSAAPVWPPGIAVRGFRRGRDEAAVHAAVTEASARGTTTLSSGSRSRNRRVSTRTPSHSPAATSAITATAQVGISGGSKSMRTGSICRLFSCLGY